MKNYHGKKEKKCKKWTKNPKIFLFSHWVFHSIYFIANTSSGDIKTYRQRQKRYKMKIIFHFPFSIRRITNQNSWQMSKSNRLTNWWTDDVVKKMKIIYPSSLQPAKNEWKTTHKLLQKYLIIIISKGSFYTFTMYRTMELMQWIARKIDRFFDINHRNTFYNIYDNSATITITFI